MNDEFKNKIQAYLEGKLTGKEKSEIEAEIQKLEDYQEVMDCYMDKVENHANPGGCEENRQSGSINEKRILFTAIWKARFQNALTTIGIVLIVVMICSIITSLYYSMGQPSRVEVYRDLIASAIAVTQPNLKLGSSSMQVEFFFTMHFNGEIVKQIGIYRQDVGEIDLSFLFNKASFPKVKWERYTTGNKRLFELRSGGIAPWVFSSPGYQQLPLSSSDNSWDKLQMVSDRIMVEVYIQLDQIYSTDEILSFLKDKNALPVWFHVKARDEKRGEEEEREEPIVGFPYEPIWHDDDWKMTKYKEEKWGLGKSVMYSKEAPLLEEYGSGKLREENFIKTLMAIKQHENIIENVLLGPEYDFVKIVDFIEKNGVQIKGIIITGDLRDILELRKEKWISDIKVGESRSEYERAF